MEEEDSYSRYISDFFKSFIECLPFKNLLTQRKTQQKIGMATVYSLQYFLTFFSMSGSFIV